MIFFLLNVPIPTNNFKSLIFLIVPPQPTISHVWTFHHLGQVPQCMIFIFASDQTQPMFFCPKVFSLCLISWQKSSCDKICRAAIGANPLRANKGAIWPKLPNTTSYCSKQSRQRVQCEVYFKLKPSNFLSACRGCKYSSILRTDASKSVWREF